MNRKSIPVLLAALAAALIAGCMKAGDGLGLTSNGNVAAHIDPCVLNPLAAGCPVDPCVQDPALPGCGVDPCLADPMLPECIEAACKVDPTPSVCKPALDCSLLPKNVECLDREYFAANVLPIFKSKCVSCHAKPSGSAWGTTQLSLEESLAWDSLVNIPARLAPRARPMKRVWPGLPDSSFLYLKITTPPSGGGVKMPASGAPLTQAQLDIVKTWIIGKP